MSSYPMAIEYDPEVQKEAVLKYNYKGETVVAQNLRTGEVIQMDKGAVLDATDGGLERDLEVVDVSVSC